MNTTAMASDGTTHLTPLSPIPMAPLPDRPLVSVLISNYNYGRYLSDAIKSVLSQTYKHLEVIVCDDGSTDASLHILEQLKPTDSRIKTVYQVNGGQSLALNAAFHQSMGDIICLLDADDIFLPDKVRLVVDALTAAPESGFAVHRMLLVDKGRKLLGEIPFLYDLPSGWQAPRLTSLTPQIVPGLPPTSGLSLHRSAAEVIFPLPAALKAYSDTLIQVVAPLLTPIVAIDTPLTEYRIHGCNVACSFTESRLRNILLYEREIWRAWRRYLASSRSGLPPGYPLPSAMAPSPMACAYARFRSRANFRAIYRSIPRTHLRTLPRPHQWYWRVSLILPNWLFRKSFDFVYGQTRSKMIARKVLIRLRGGPTRLKSASYFLLKSPSWFTRPAPTEPATSSGPDRQKTASGERAYFNVLGINVNATQIPDVLTMMEKWIADQDGCRCIAATSMHGIVEAQRDVAFKKILNTTDLNVPDGMPLVWLGRRRGYFLPRRVYGPDLLLAFCEKTKGRGYRHFFYGGEPGVAEKLAKSLQARFPGIRTVGTLSPPFRPLTAEEEENIVNQISNASPDIVWVGLGTPKQERWMHEHRNSLRVPVLVGVGAAFNILAGRRRQAPRWMREHGLEWLFRLLQEPRRLWRRYLIYGTQFTAYLLLESLGLKKFPPAGKASNS